jgi:hypothetical protein
VAECDGKNHNWKKVDIRTMRCTCGAEVSGDCCSAKDRKIKYLIDELETVKATLEICRIQLKEKDD